MSDLPETYGTVFAGAAKKHGLATAALALSITALATGGGDLSSTATPSPTTAEPLELAAPASDPTGPRKRLEVATDVEVAPGASITASGAVELGARAVAIDGCVGHYDEATRLCVLSPGPWELHSACYDRAGDEPSTLCEVIVRNTGAVPLKFSGYVEVAAP